MAITPKAGKNGLIYVSGSDIVGANAWSISMEHDAITYSVMGDTWESNLSGIHRFSGSIGAWHDQDAKLLQDAMAADATCTLLIYPDRTDLTTYYNGSAIFSSGSTADMGSPVAVSADFTGSGSLTMTGFS